MAKKPGTCSRRCKGKNKRAFNACLRRCMKKGSGLGQAKKRKRVRRVKRRRRR